MTTKKDLIAYAAERKGIQKSTVEKILNAVLDQIERCLRAGEQVTINGFGTFTIKQRDARTGRNPRTGEPVEIAASASVAFKPAKALKDSLN